MENHYFYGKNHYKWPFSIAMLNYQRVHWTHRYSQSWHVSTVRCPKHWNQDILKISWLKMFVENPESKRPYPPWFIIPIWFIIIFPLKNSQWARPNFQKHPSEASFFASRNLFPYIYHQLSPLPSGKLSHNYGKSPCLVGKSTISTGPWLQVRKLLVITRG